MPNQLGDDRLGLQVILAVLILAVLERYPRLEISRCEHHYVFYLHPDDQPSQIIAVLHKKIDVLTRLKNRLPQKSVLA